MMLAAWLKQDHGLILGGYGLVAAGLTTYAWFTMRKARELSRRLPDEDKPWT
jgi:heme A synthase